MWSQQVPHLPLVPLKNLLSRILACISHDLLAMPPLENIPLAGQTCLQTAVVTSEVRFGNPDACMTAISDLQSTWTLHNKPLQLCKRVVQVICSQEHRSHDTKLQADAKWRQRSTAQHSTAQHSTAQHSTAQHSTAQHSTAQHSTAQHSTAQHRTAQHSTAQHSTAQHSTAQHSTAQHSTAQHSTAQHRAMDA